MSYGQADSAHGRPQQVSPEPTVPQDRYGRTRRSARMPHGWRLWLLVLLVLGAGAALTYIAYRNLGAAPIEAERVGFEERPGNAMEITIAVRRDDQNRPGVCIVRVRDISGAESGRKEVYIPPSVEQVSTVIRGIDRPVTADVFGCTYNVPKYMSTS
ncbi:hypothetical protein FHU38_001026 [Saccharomonospora amisosensis]|uniref:DUF4307 domain-containing protein n=1 Tax=Saccharomonospora amisosensis TaxID=1128677 RepID=A0A7X5UME7_9PSEU|nr:DUF4307 domain-containing protein [Saccharomonospora amisosensis]NIJ10682.1 hypothetical protein [Saccharomonospora amisosensis]